MLVAPASFIEIACNHAPFAGCLAERTHLFAYPVFTAVLSSIVHPVAAHWVWADGWMTRVSDTCQFLDYAGGAVSALGHSGSA